MSFDTASSNSGSNGWGFNWEGQWVDLGSNGYTQSGNGDQWDSNSGTYVMGNPPDFHSNGVPYHDPDTTTSSGGSNSTSQAAPNTSVTTAASTAVPSSLPTGNDVDSISGGGGRVAESPVLGIQPQETVATVEQGTPLTFGTLQVTQAVVGTDQRDVITGSDAGEALAGGKGKDQMTGGGGPDAFVFETPGEFGKKSADVITDFDPDEGDKVAIASDAFEGVSKIKFKSVTGKKNAKNTASSNKTFIYDEKKGVLYFNQNGRDDGFGDGGEFVKLLGATELSKSDFVIV